MIGELSPRGYLAESAAYMFTVRFSIQELIYAIIRHVDDIEENYNSLVYTFFLGVMAKGWGEGYGWSKTAEGNWRWTLSDEA